MRLGCLPYLNVKPLVYPFERGEAPEGWELVYEPPSVLAQLLSEGDLAAAPVSSFATFLNQNLWTVPRICIASRGAVRSVLMVSKVEIPKIKSIALDTSSLSGAAMLKIILSELYKLDPRYIRMDPHPVEMLQAADAALLIGNAAMLMHKEGLHVLDLGSAWMKLTGLPAVFAVWAGPRDLLCAELIEVLERAKETGLQKIEEISRLESINLGLPFDICHDYLANVMKYDLLKDEIISLEIFAQKAHEHGLLEIVPEVKVVKD